MKAKPWISIMAAGLMAVSMLAGCKTSGSAPGQAAETQAAETQTAEESQEKEHTEAETSPAAGNTAETGESREETGEGAAGGAASAENKTLVVYYSASGRTEAVAKVIADAAGADLFVLEPAEPYTSDDLNYSDDNSRVSREHENEAERVVELVLTEAPGWSDYDTVFIGYPIWWGIAAWPVNEFIKTNDFTGKTVIPFCTSASSGLGESGKLLAEMAGTGNWQEGMRFRSGASEEDVRGWVSGLGLGQ